MNCKKTRFRPGVFVPAEIAILLSLIHEQAFASTGPLPYESWLIHFVHGITGTLPATLSIIGIVALGLILIFRDDVNAFFRLLLAILLVI
ncbi:MAG: TrbC/VirB2 family protein [Nitrosomonas sp.]|nr:TrbC/VirB2 family protein [Nitrosomonas sp.]